MKVDMCLNIHYILISWIYLPLNVNEPEYNRAISTMNSERLRLKSSAICDSSASHASAVFASTKSLRRVNLPQCRVTLFKFRWLKMGQNTCYRRHRFGLEIFLRSDLKGTLRRDWWRPYANLLPRIGKPYLKSINLCTMIKKTYLKLVQQLRVKWI